MATASAKVFGSPFVEKLDNLLLTFDISVFHGAAVGP
jgi:hypothetical protein